ncbi:hypothetical protein CB1_001533017 [Camelus ferus]|nr:hypothetical protein CB1_001533017 [Camelus ferus]
MSLCQGSLQVYCRRQPSLPSFCPQMSLYKQPAAGSGGQPGFPLAYGDLESRQGAPQDDVVTNIEGLLGPGRRQLLGGRWAPRGGRQGFWPTIGVPGARVRQEAGHSVAVRGSAPADLQPPHRCRPGADRCALSAPAISSPVIDTSGSLNLRKAALIDSPDG